MDNKDFIGALTLVRKHSKKRNFSQTVDLVINLRGLNLKKPEDNILNFLALPHSKGKKNNIGALVGGELASKAKESCDLVIVKDKFRDYGVDAKKTKKMARKVDFFIAQANLMPDVAKAFGKVLGPLGKMPNPKAGAIVPPAIPDLKPVVNKLKNTVKLQTKNEQVVKVAIGLESMKDEEVADNAMAVYNNIFHAVHENKHAIKAVILKFSMGVPFVVGKKYSEDEITALSKSVGGKRSLSTQKPGKEKIEKKVKPEVKKEQPFLKKNVGEEKKKTVGENKK